VQLSSPSSLDEGTRAAVGALAAAVEAADGAPPLSDQALAQLSSSAVRHVVAADGSELLGYAQLAGDSLELVGAAEILGPLLDEFGESSLHVWAHGARSRLSPVLAARDFRPVRTLLQLRRPLAPVAERPTPEGVRIDPFVVGRDEDAWVRVNAAAFASHPEQGRWTRADLEAREAQAWFDPAGFLLAWRGNELLGYHWTKVHSATLGEVYVLGVDPSAQGLGLGGVLLDRGLAHLLARGCHEVLLYVEADNTVALRLYERSGFSEYDRDTQWRSP
jgi:mycothiol synthase